MRWNRDLPSLTRFRFCNRCYRLPGWRIGGTAIVERETQIADRGLYQPGKAQVAGQSRHTGTSRRTPSALTPLRRLQGLFGNPFRFDVRGALGEALFVIIRTPSQTECDLGDKIAIKSSAVIARRASKPINAQFILASPPYGTHNRQEHQ